MFTEKDIDELVWAIILQHSELNTEIISKIIAEMTHIASLDRSFINSYTINPNALNEAVTRTTKRVMNEIENLLYAVGKNTYLDTKYLYDYRDKEFLKFGDNEKIIQSVSNTISRSRIDYSSAMNKTGLLVRDKGIVKLKKLDSAYVNLMNDAKTSVVLNTNLNTDYYINNLCDNGLRIFSQPKSTVSSYNATGFVESLFTNAAKDIQTDVLEEVGTQVQSMGVELSAHIMPAPDHAPVQGKQFTKENFDKMQNGEDFEDLNGTKYIGFPRPIGAWNCRHITYPIIVGVSKPRKSERTLKKILSDNEKGYTMTTGRHYTLYECTQYQRRLEREVRKYKTMYEVAKSAKDKNLMSKYKSRINSKTNEYKLFSKRAGVPTRMERLEVE